MPDISLAGRILAAFSDDLEEGQKTADALAPQLRANAATLQALGLQAGESAKVRQGGGCAVLTVALDAAVPDNCLRVAAAHPTTASLGAMFGDISVERA